MRYPLGTCFGRYALGLALRVAAATAAATDTDPLLPTATAAYPPDLLARLRAAADDVPGAAPREIRYLKVAESHRPRSATNGDRTTWWSRTGWSR